MRNGRRVETRRDRKAMARDAGLGTISFLSVLAGALCGLALLEILIVIGAALAVAINGGTNFASISTAQFKTITGLIAVVATFVAFILGGYVTGRMSRRGGAAHGVLSGMVGTVVAALAALAVIRSGADQGLARVARHINVADTWHQWRSFALLETLVAVAAMVLGGLVGGVEGERWHGKLLARAVDPAYGPEAEERAESRRRITEAEVARLAAADRVGRLTSATQSAQTRPSATEPAVPAGGEPSPDRSTVTVASRQPVTAATPVAGSNSGTTESRGGGRGRHLLGRHKRLARH